MKKTVKRIIAFALLCAMCGSIVPMNSVNAAGLSIAKWKVFDYGRKVSVNFENNTGRKITIVKATVNRPSYQKVHWDTIKSKFPKDVYVDGWKDKKNNCSGFDVYLHGLSAIAKHYGKSLDDLSADDGDAWQDNPDVRNADQSYMGKPDCVYYFMDDRTWKAYNKKLAFSPKKKAVAAHGKKKIFFKNKIYGAFLFDSKLDHITVYYKMAGSKKTYKLRCKVAQQ